MSTTVRVGRSWRPVPIFNGTWKHVTTSCISISGWCITREWNWSTIMTWSTTTIGETCSAPSNSRSVEWIVWYSYLKKCQKCPVPNRQDPSLPSMRFLNLKRECVIYRLIIESTSQLMKRSEHTTFSSWKNKKWTMKESRKIKVYLMFLADFTRI